MKRLILTILVILTVCIACICGCAKGSTATQSEKKARGVQTTDVDTPEQDPDGCEDGRCEKRFPEFRFYISINDISEGKHRRFEGFFEPRFPHKKDPAPAPVPVPDPDLTEPQA